MHPSGLFGTSQLVDVGAARQVIVEPAGGRPSRKPLPNVGCGDVTGRSSLYVWILVKLVLTPCQFFASECSSFWKGSLQRSVARDVHEFLQVRF